MKLTDYIRSDRRGREARRLEREAMDDPLLREAMEGFETVEGDHEAALKRMEARLQVRTARPRRHTRARLWGVAAALLLAGALGSLYYLSHERERLIPSVAVTEERAADKDTTKQTETIAEKTEDSVRTPQKEATQDRKQLAANQEALKATKEESAVTDLDLTKSSESRSDMQAAPEAIQETERIEEAPVPSERVAAAVPTPAHRTETLSFDAASNTTKASSSRRNMITGRVVDEEGQPVIGANVSIKGSSRGTATDVTGYFSFPAEKGETTLIASFLGMEPTKVENVTPGKPVIIAMNSDPQALADMVVVAYGTAKKKDLTGSLTTPDADKKTRARDLQKVPEEEVPGEQVSASESGSKVDTPKLSARRMVFAEYVSDNLIPQTGAEGQAIHGKVIAEFKTDRKGRPDNIRILESPAPEASREARRLIRASGTWPATEDPIQVEIEF